MLYARFLSPTSDLLMLQQISNTYGNSMGWLNSANTGKGAASAYQQVSVPNTNNMIPGDGTASMAGQLQIAAQGATVDISDSVRTTTRKHLGPTPPIRPQGRRTLQIWRPQPRPRTRPSKPSWLKLQRINQALLLQLRTLQDANQINANLALQQIIAQKQQQDAMKSTLRTLPVRELLQRQYHHDQQWVRQPPNAGVLRAASKRTKKGEGIRIYVYSLSIHRSGVPVAGWTVAPSITAMGVHIVLALATIMMVWFGVQEALASAHGGPGFSMGRFWTLHALPLQVMANYYDSSIPGLGFSIKGFIDGGTINLVNLIGSDGSTPCWTKSTRHPSKTGPSNTEHRDESPYDLIVYFAVQFLLARRPSIVSAIVAYGAIAATIIGVLV